MTGCKGAFTGAIAKRMGLVENAAGGKLFLDELGDVPLSVQTDLLRFLQTRRFRPLGSDEERSADVRLVATAQPDLPDKIGRGEFRSDLFYRLAEVEIATPRLADVPEDIRRIIRHIVYRCRTQDGLASTVEETLAYFGTGEAILRSYRWPGNVRELSHYVRRRLFLGDNVLEEIAQLARRGSIPRLPLASFRRSTGRRISNAITRGYVRHVWACRGNLSEREIFSALQLSINTFKSYLK